MLSGAGLAGSRNRVHGAVLVRRPGRRTSDMQVSNPETTSPVPEVPSAV
jgi:hypothetical protein